MVVTRGTTVSCSLLLVLIVFFATAPRAKQTEPLGLVPVRPVWTLALNNRITRAPLYDAERAYFFIEGDRLVAYDIATGRQQWLVDAHPVADAAAANDLVYVGEAGGVIARRVADGSVAWKIVLERSPAVPLVADGGWLLVATAGGSLSAFRAADGRLVWQHDAGAEIHAAPTLSGDRVYVPAVNGRVLALDTKTGARLWERRIGGSANDLVAAGERLYVGSADNFLYCLLRETGEIDWRWRTGADVRGLPLTDDRLVYFVSLDNVLRALNLVSGGQKWMRALPLRPAWAPSIIDGTLVVAGQASTVRTYNAKDGTPATEISAGGEVAAAPHLLRQPLTGLPMILIVTRDLVKGATASLHVRTIDPQPTPLGPLPNAVTPAPTLPVPPAVPAAISPGPR